MLKEEFDWEQVQDYIYSTVTTVFVGPSFDDRSSLFPNLWNNWNCNLVRLVASRDYSQDITITVSKLGTEISTFNGEIVAVLKQFLASESEKLEVVCMDLSSLQHPVLMFLCNLLLKQVKPKQFFASYVEPIEYQPRSHLGDFLLSDELLGLRAVPGFARRKRGKPSRLLAFLGFEGERLIKVIEEDIQTNIIIPIIGFPSFRPGWQARSLRNCMRAIEYAQASNDIQKCNAESVFDAYELIRRLKPTSGGEEYALAPLGTRPHSLACAIYATLNPDTRIVFDHPVEVNRRSSGILRTRCYHLSSFIPLIRG